MTQNSDVSEQQQLDYILSISKYHTKGIKYNAIIWIGEAAVEPWFFLVIPYVDQTGRSPEWPKSIASYSLKAQKQL